MRMGNPIVGVLFAVLLAGCATSQTGKAFSHSSAEAFVEGKTTRQEIEAELGRAAAVSNTTDGRTILVYSHIVSHGNGLTGKGSATGQMATFVLDAKGLLISKTITAVGSNTNPL